MYWPPQQPYLQGTMPAGALPSVYPAMPSAVPQQQLVMPMRPPALPQLTAEALSKLTAAQQKQQLGERLYALSYRYQPSLAAKITGMILELENNEILGILGSEEKLRQKIDEAVSVLSKQR